MLCELTRKPATLCAQVVNLLMTGPYVCGRCTRLRASAAVATPCGATLIVCPTPILEQWRQEIQKHIRDGVATIAHHDLRLSLSTLQMRTACSLHALLP